MKGVKAGSSQQYGSTNDSVSRSVTDATVERMHVIPYSDLVLRRKLDGGLSLIEASESGSEREYCWEDAWKLYMQTQTATLKDLAARVQECNPQIDTIIASSESAPISVPYLDSSDNVVEETRTSTIVDEIQNRDAHEKKSSFLVKLRAKILGRRRTIGLILLNVLAALYGSSTVAGKFATDIAPGLPASLSSVARFSSALLVFLPALRNVLGQDKNSALLKAGAELGGWLFAAAILESCGDGGASSDAPLLFAFTMIFVPIMELCAGRQSVRNITRIASLVALSGMGVLEEEGLGWKGISLPQVGDVWGLAASAIYALHIFRSEAHSKSFKPFELTAIQCGTVASLSLVWEISRVLHGNTNAVEYVTQLQGLPWGPLVYTGLVCSGLCSWLEIHGLRWVHASTATMVNTTIPIWGAFLSFLLRGESLDDSALVGGLVILVASLFAQLVSKQDDTDTPRPLQTTAACEVEESQPRKMVSSPPDPNPATDHVQGAIITSQLKFPYYAAQAKRLLVEAKVKLVSVKSLVMSATSALLTTAPPVPSDSLHSAAPTAIATSVTLQQAANAVKTSAATSASSSLPLPPAAMVLQWLDVAAGVVESAITALGSDMVQAVEDAEDIAKVVEQTSQTAMDHMAMAAASVDSMLVSLDWASLEFLKSVDETTAGTLVDHSLECTLPVISHHADTVLQLLLSCSSIPN